MPFFTYKCSPCNTEFEKLVSSYKDEVQCPDCKKVCERLFRPNDLQVIVPAGKCGNASNGYKSTL